MQDINKTLMTINGDGVGTSIRLRKIPVGQKN